MDIDPVNSMALKSGQMADLNVPAPTLEKARAWLTRVGATGRVILITAGAVAGMNLLFHLMHVFGRRLRPDPGEEGKSLLEP